MTARVSALILSELETRAECLEEECPDDADLIREAITLTRAGTKPTGDVLQSLHEELRVIELILWDDRGGRRQFHEAAAWYGYLEVAPDPKKVTYLGKKPHIVVVDGIRYYG